jgi:hypothetical protein
MIWWTACLTRILSDSPKLLHLPSGNLNFCQFQAGPVISPVTKKPEAAHQHTAPATMILVVSVRKGEKIKKRISSGSSLESISIKN